MPNTTTPPHGDEWMLPYRTYLDGDVDIAFALFSSNHIVSWTEGKWNYSLFCNIFSIIYSRICFILFTELKQRPQGKFLMGCQQNHRVTSMHGGNPNGSVATSDVDSFVYLLFIIFFLLKKGINIEKHRHLRLCYILKRLTLQAAKAGLSTLITDL